MYLLKLTLGLIISLNKWWWSLLSLMYLPELMKFTEFNVSAWTNEDEVYWV